MILPFSTELNGKPTLFIEKIWEGLFRNNFFNGSDDEFNCYFDNHIERFGKRWDELPSESRLEFPKIHTIRHDKSDRWKKDVMIDFFINARQKNMFRFAPRIPVVSTQKIHMSYAFNDVIEITIGGRYIYDFKEKEQLAKNDGFDSYEEFFDYFYPLLKNCENEFFVGKIIHWTDYRYEKRD